MSRPTPYDELNGVLEDLVTESHAILGTNLLGAYVQGSFALGAGDVFSDCDFVVALHEPLSTAQEHGLRALHATIPTRPGHWTHHLEGSYGPAADLATNERIGRDWLFIDHGQRTMEWSDHCNSEVARWILHGHGIALTGPEAATLVAPVPAELLRARMRRDVLTFRADMATWTSPEIAWYQRYTVIALCRIAFTAATGAVASKPAALQWAHDTLDPRWRSLIEAVVEDRPLGFDAAMRPRRGALQQTDLLTDYVIDLVLAAA